VGKGTKKGLGRTAEGHDSQSSGGVIAIKREDDELIDAELPEGISALTTKK